MITFYSKNGGALKELPSFEKGSWVYVENPTEEEMERLVKEFSLEKGLILDAVDPYEVPRIEIENSIAYVFMRVAWGEEDKITTAPFMAALNGEFFVTVSRVHLPFIPKFLEGKIEFSTTQKIKFFLRFLSEVSATYNHALTQINRKVRSISVNVERINNTDIIQFITFENILHDFNSSLSPMNDSLKMIIHDKIFPLIHLELDILKDIILSNDQLVKTCTANIRMIANIRGAYSTIMTNNLNQIIRFLTVVTVILTPSVIVTSFYGMNLALPFMHSPNAVWIVITVIFTTSIFLLGIFVAKRWL